AGPVGGGGSSGGGSSGGASSGGASSGGASSASAATVSAAIASSLNTALVTGIATATVSVLGLATPIPYVGYSGDSSFTGYALINGRWFNAPGEVVTPTNFLRQTGLHVGDSLTATYEGRPMALTIVGEIFDQARENRDDLVIRGTFASMAAVAPDSAFNRWELAPKPGVDPHDYVDELREALGQTAYVQAVDSSDTN